jgi:hypothetical protein
MYKKIVMALLISFGLSGCLSQKGYTLTVPTSSVNDKIQKKFPMTKKVSYGTITFSNPKLITKKGSDRLQTGTDFIFKNMLLGSIKGRVYISGNLLYEAKTKKFFLINPKVDDLNLLGKDIVSMFGGIVKGTM